jgi:hypothetical protein
MQALQGAGAFQVTMVSGLPPTNYGPATPFRLTLVGPRASSLPGLHVRRTGPFTTVVVSGVGSEGTERDLVSWGPTGATWVRSSAAGEPLSFRACGAAPPIGQTN